MRAAFIFFWWTHGESNSKLIHAMDAYYHYTMGPELEYATKFYLIL